MSQRNPRIQYRCSFCGKAEDQVQRLVAGPGGVYICNECVALCQDIMSYGQSAVPEEAAAQPRATIACLLCGQPMTEAAHWGIAYAPAGERWRVRYWLHEDCMRQGIPPDIAAHLPAGDDTE